VLVSGFGTNQAEVIDTGSDQIVGRVAVPQPHNSAISPDGRRAYVGSQQQGETALVAVDLTSMTRTGTIPLDKTPRALSFSPDGRWVYFTLAGSDAVQVLDASRNEVVGQIPVGVSPHLPTFTPDGRLGLVVAQGPGELDLIDPTSVTESGAITVGAAPHWLTTSADGRTAYVTDESSNDVSIVDLASRQVVASVPVGNGPRKIAVQPGTSMAASGGMAMDGMTMSAPAQAAAAPSGSQPSRSGPTSMKFNDHGTVDVRGQDEIDLEADDNYFAPTFLRGAPGQTLTLVVENESSSLHNVSIPGLGVDTNVAPHGSTEIQVTFPQSGSTTYFCKFHTALGMNGALLVGDATP
jgi:YVTN family beta-propeller protein